MLFQNLRGPDALRDSLVKVIWNAVVQKTIPNLNKTAEF